MLDRIDLDYELRGREAVALCPAHKARTGKQDHNPSWSINIDSGVHYCFSCGWKGGLGSVVGAVLGIGYDEAQDWISLNKVAVDPAELKEKVKTAHITRRIRIASPEVDEALYRSFDDPTEDMLASRHITLESAQRYGLKMRDEDTWVLPIHDAEGKLAGWQEKCGPRVRNRPLGVQKSRSVFGMEQVNSERVIVVESPLDAVLGHSAGLESTVALFGAQPSREQAELLSAFQPVLALDNDDAGRKGQKILAEMLFGLGVNPHVITWPAGAKDFGDIPHQLADLAMKSVLQAQLEGSW